MGGGGGGKPNTAPFCHDGSDLEDNAYFRSVLAEVVQLRLGSRKKKGAVKELR